MTKTPSLARRSGWLALLMLLLAAFVAVSCSGEPPAPPATLGSGSDASTPDSSTGSRDCSRPGPGCACDDEGAQVKCGEVVRKDQGQTICGPGVSTCIDGRWSDCAINYSDLVSVPDAPPGFEARGLGTPTPCTNNPCDPYCVTYPDTPGGLVDAGTNLDASDAGLTPTTDAGSLPCGARTCASLGKNCGNWGNGCGGVLTCGTCTGGETCGGAGTPGVCGTPPPLCVPTTCAALGKNCGTMSDGCGNTLNCGSCPVGQTCGGSGTPSVCGSPWSTCTPKTCFQLGATCGPMADGCGNLLNCGSCQSPQTCGGGGVPSQCGTPAGCTGLCPYQQQNCAAGVTTKITGTVYAPNGDEPLPNAIVYVPNGAVQPFAAGVSCDNCAVASGDPLVSTTTAVDGTFTINNMPATANVPLVIQIGRWRRQFTIPNVPACQTTNLNVTLRGTYGNPPIRFPKNKAEGDIPKIAISTGCVDAMECVLRKMGVDDSEFSNPSGSGRINFYRGGYCPGTYKGSASNTPWESSLLSSTAALSKYDMVLFPCQGAQFAYSGWNTHTTYQNNLANYANSGGRVFATHYSYIWLYDDGGWYYGSPLSNAFNWNINAGAWNSGTGYIQTGFARGSLLANWLYLPAVGASTTFGQIPLDVIRKDYNSVNASTTTNWMNMTKSGSTFSVHATFDTPLNQPASAQCGRVVFSDFHVENHANSQIAFPTECDAGGTALTAQEKLLEYMLFDLASCVGSTPPPPACTKRTCAQQGVTCGQTGDGCGGTLTCGSPCQPPACVPTTCAAQSLSCGVTGDGCGGTLDCGTCTGSQTCGGAGVPGQCGTPPPSCTPTTCAAQGLACGQAGDGCSGTLDCGTCTAPDTCGGGGMPGQCGHADIFNEGEFVRTYDTSGCPSGTQPVWGLWSWNSTTPGDSRIEFRVQTAATLAGLASAPKDPLKFSNPPGPGALVGQQCVAHQAGQPAGSPNTQVGSASVNATLANAGRFTHFPYVRITSTLKPTTDKLQGPLLTSWNLQVSCQPAE